MPRTHTRISGPVDQDPNIPAASPAGVTISTQIIRTGADGDEATAAIFRSLCSAFKRAITARIRRYRPYRNYTNDQLDQISGKQH